MQWVIILQQYGFQILLTVLSNKENFKGVGYLVFSGIVRGWLGPLAVSRPLASEMFTIFSVADSGYIEVRLVQWISQRSIVRLMLIIVRVRSSSTCLEPSWACWLHLLWCSNMWPPYSKYSTITILLQKILRLCKFWDILWILFLGWPASFGNLNRIQRQHLMKINKR